LLTLRTDRHDKKTCLNSTFWQGFFVLLCINVLHSFRTYEFVSDKWLDTAQNR
jgi:hypothetical protein